MKIQKSRSEKRKLRAFLSYLRYDLSRAFLFSQAAVDAVLKDEIYSLARGLDRVFSVTNGIINCELDKELPELRKFFEENKKGTRSYLSPLFSESVTLTKVPNIIKKIIKNNKDKIHAYLGKGFLFEDPIIFRNYHFDENFSRYDVYSNVWHQDSHDGNRILKIFVLLHRVDVGDGPFHYLNEKSTHGHWGKVRDRWSFHTLKGIQQFDDQIMMTGDPGSFLIIDTSRCIHRAGIPKTKRDMMQITLYPNWRKSPDRAVYRN